MRVRCMCVCARTCGVQCVQKPPQFTFVQSSVSAMFRPQFVAPCVPMHGQTKQPADVHWSLFDVRRFNNSQRRRKKREGKRKVQMNAKAQMRKRAGLNQAGPRTRTGRVGWRVWDGLRVT